MLLPIIRSSVVRGGLARTRRAARIVPTRNAARVLPTRQRAARRGTGQG